MIDRKGRFCSRRWGRSDFFYRDGNRSLLFLGRHRRLAKAGSPATARGCGELWRALLAAAVAVSAPNYKFEKVLSFTHVGKQSQKHL